MYCGMKRTDYGLRIQVNENTKVHAAYASIAPKSVMYKDGRRTEIPEHEVIYTACSYREHSADQMIEPLAPITCKKCIAAIEYEPDTAPKRYVVYDPALDMWYKKSGSRGTRWSTHIQEAYVFKSRGAAKASLYTNTNYEIKEVNIVLAE